MLSLDEDGVKAPLTVAFLLSSLANLILLNNSKTSCFSAIVRLALYPSDEAPLPPHRPPRPRPRPPGYPHPPAPLSLGGFEHSRKYWYRYRDRSRPIRIGKSDFLAGSLFYTKK